VTHLHTGVRHSLAHIQCATASVVRPAVSLLGRCDVLTIAKLSRWSIDYYNETARATACLGSSTRQPLANIRTQPARPR
jgi:hypothetical protein